MNQGYMGSNEVALRLKSYSTNKTAATVARELRESNYEGLNSSEARVYEFILSHANDKLGVAYMFISTIAEALNISERTVQRCLDKLINLGFILRQFRRIRKCNNQASTFYVLAMFDQDNSWIIKRFVEMMPIFYVSATTLDDLASIFGNIKAELAELIMQKMAKVKETASEIVDTVTEKAKDIVGKVVNVMNNEDRMYNLRVKITEMNQKEDINYIKEIFENENIFAHHLDVVELVMYNHVDYIVRAINDSIQAGKKTLAYIQNILLESRK